MLSEVAGTATASTASSALQYIAELAPALKEGELRVLIYLATMAEASHQKGHPYTALASSRSIAKATKMARPSVQRAIDSLSRRRIIGLREGTATKAAGYIVHGLDTVRIGGIFGEPPPASLKSQGGLFGEPPVASLESQGGIFERPPQTPGQGEQYAGARIDLKSDSINLIDRVLKAKPKNFDPKRLAEAAAELHGYQAKFAGDKNPHPPDAGIVAQFLAVDTWPRLSRLLHELMCTREQCGDRYSWYVSVALQRLHGIGPQVVKQRRETLRIVHRAGLPSATNEGQQYAQDLLADVVQSKRGGMK